MANQEAAHIWVMGDVNKELSNFSKGIQEYSRQSWVDKSNRYQTLIHLLAVGTIVEHEIQGILPLYLPNGIWH